MLASIWCPRPALFWIGTQTWNSKDAVILLALRTVEQGPTDLLDFSVLMVMEGFEPLAQGSVDRSLLCYFLFKFCRHVQID
jgi:hypothetical protein